MGWLFIYTHSLYTKLSAKPATVPSLANDPCNPFKKGGHYEFSMGRKIVPEKFEEEKGRGNKNVVHVYT